MATDQTTEADAPDELKSGRSSPSRNLAKMGSNVFALFEIARETYRERATQGTRYVSGRVSSEEDIKANRMLVTEVMRKYGQIPDDEYDFSSGLPLVDTYHDEGFCTYFSCFDTQTAEEQPLQVAAKLLWKPDATITDLRTPLEQMNPTVAQFLEGLQPGKVAEIGGLAKQEGAPKATTIALFRALFEFADQKEIDYFVAGLEPKVLPSLKSMFGDAIRLIHEEEGHVLPPGSHGLKKGIILDVKNAAKIYRDSMIRGAAGAGRWLERSMGVEPESPPEEQSALKKLGNHVVGSVIFGYFANTVPGFQALRSR